MNFSRKLLKDFSNKLPQRFRKEVLKLLYKKIDCVDMVKHWLRKHWPHKITCRTCKIALYFASICRSRVFDYGKVDSFHIKKKNKLFRVSLTSIIRGRGWRTTATNQVFWRRIVNSVLIWL